MLKYVGLSFQTKSYRKEMSKILLWFIFRAARKNGSAELLFREAYISFEVTKKELFKGVTSS